MREIKKLSARAVSTLTKPGRHSDGDGLYLVIDPSGARRWLFMFRWEGKLKEMGLGGFPGVTLADARDSANAARHLVRSGVNPIAARRTAKAVSHAGETFGSFADALVEDIKSGFRNEKHRWQWGHTLKVYAAPLRPIAIEAVTTQAVLEILRPMWATKQETASRLRGRIERVLDAAKAKGLRTGENPARWRGHLDQLLPRRQKLQRGHHPAMPYADLPTFFAELSTRKAVAALALQYTILCASRSGEVLGATWSEIDRKNKVWTIPGARMKAGIEHRVPLSSKAIGILDQAEKVKHGEYVFPGQGMGKPLSNMAMAMLLKQRMKRSGFTVHGFRSSFRDWAGELTAFPQEIAEAALAHIVGNATARAYRRGDALEKRRKLMNAWSRFLTIPRSEERGVPVVRKPGARE